MVRGWIAVAIWYCMGCLVGPPISEKPEPLDTPPTITALDPGTDGAEVIDRTTTVRRTFQILGVRGLELEDDIGYQFFLTIGEGVRRPAGPRGILGIDESASTDSVVVYQRVEFQLDACAEDLGPSAAEVEVLLTVELTDPVPLNQVERLGIVQHVVSASWLILLEGECLTAEPL